MGKNGDSNGRNTYISLFLQLLAFARLFPRLTLFFELVLPVFTTLCQYFFEIQCSFDA